MRAEGCEKSRTDYFSSVSIRGCLAMVKFVSQYSILRQKRMESNLYRRDSGAYLLNAVELARNCLSTRVLPDQQNPARKMVCDMKIALVPYVI